jgi:hypothetical protein
MYIWKPVLAMINHPEKKPGKKSKKGFGNGEQKPEWPAFYWVAP